MTTDPAPIPTYFEADADNGLTYAEWREPPMTTVHWAYPSSTGTTRDHDPEHTSIPTPVRAAIALLIMKEPT